MLIPVRPMINAFLMVYATSDFGQRYSLCKVTPANNQSIKKPEKRRKRTEEMQKGSTNHKITNEHLVESEIKNPLY